MPRLQVPALSRKASRLITWIVALAAVAALFLLAAGLDRLELRPGQSFDPAALPRAEGGPSAGGLKLTDPFLTFMVVTAGVLFGVSLIVVLRSPADRKMVGRYALTVLILAASLGLAIGLYRRPETAAVTATPLFPGTPAPGLNHPPPSATGSTGMPVTYTPPATSGWLGFAVALLAILGLGGLVFAAWRATRMPQEEIADIARSALGDLAAGRNWEDVVVRCYADMSSALSQRRGIKRQEAMTPREFAARLEQAGFPPGAVGTLTQLFEKARYGSRHSSSADSRQAIDALQAILQAMESQP